MAAYLSPLDQGKKIVLEKAIVFIGRHPECDVLITQSKKISRKHCCLAQVNDTVVIRDLGSMNGVHVNGKRVEKEQRLKLGDEVMIGDCRFVLKDALKRESPPPVAKNAGPPSSQKPAQNGASGPAKPVVRSADDGTIDFPMKPESERKKSPPQKIKEPLTPEAVPLVASRPKKDDVSDLEFFDEDEEPIELELADDEPSSDDDEALDQLEVIGLDDDVPIRTQRAKEPEIDDLEFLDDDDDVMTLDEDDEFQDSGSHVGFAKD